MEKKTEILSYFLLTGASSVNVHYHLYDNFHGLKFRSLFDSSMLKKKINGKKKNGIAF